MVWFQYNYKNWMHSFVVSLGYESVDRTTFSTWSTTALHWKCTSVNAFIPQWNFKRMHSILKYNTLKFMSYTGQMQVAYIHGKLHDFNPMQWRNYADYESTSLCLYSFSPCANINLIVFGLIRSLIETTIYRTGALLLVIAKRLISLE